MLEKIDSTLRCGVLTKAFKTRWHNRQTGKSHMAVSGNNAISDFGPNSGMYVQKFRNSNRNNTVSAEESRANRRSRIRDLMKAVEDVHRWWAERGYVVLTESD